MRDSELGGPHSQGGLSVGSAVVFWKRKLQLESEVKDLSLSSGSACFVCRDEDLASETLFSHL